MSPRDFAETILKGFLGVRAVIVGRDFRFGHQRSGSVGDLTRLGHEFGFEVIAMPDLNVENERLPSTRIRAWLNEGHLRKVSDSFAARWMTSVSLDEDGIARFEAFQCLPPPGIYQVEIVDANGAFLSREILELHSGRCGQLSSGRISSLGTHYISGWTAIDVF